MSWFNKVPMPSLDTRRLSPKYKALLPHYGKEILNVSINRVVDQYLMSLIEKHKPSPSPAPPEIIVVPTGHSISIKNK